MMSHHTIWPRFHLADKKQIERQSISSILEFSP